MVPVWGKSQVRSCCLYVKKHANLDILKVFITGHDLNDEMLDMGRNRLLADSLNKLAKL
jgi:hypothetical protein